jgi:very-short-patch-repair endonuclease
VAEIFPDQSVLITSPRFSGERSDREAIRVRGKVMRGPAQRRTNLSRKLRADQTASERKLWSKVRDRQLGGHKFVRQEPIGPYICDFVCRQRKLVVEVDGGQHAESASDAARDKFLAEQDYRVLRFWNNEVLSNIEGVLQVI